MTPLALYKDSRGKTCLVTPDVVEKHMRLIASKVYGLDPVKDKAALALWSCHSLRVGACVLLHSLGYTEVQLMWLLRWPSNSFMNYLHNMVSLADQQSRALDKAAAMPYFF